MTTTHDNDGNDGGRVWLAQAECARRNLATELFYPSSLDPERWDPQVLEACAACPVSAECLEWAIARGEQGIWAGTGEDRRARIRRAQRRRRRQP